MSDFASLISLHIYFFHLDDKTSEEGQPNKMISVTKLIATAAALSLFQYQGDAATWSAPLRHGHAGPTHDRALKTSPFHGGLRLPSTDLGAAHGASVWARLFSSNRVGAVVDTDFKSVGRGSYVTEVAVGTPPQYVALGLDLNSADVVMLNHKVGTHEFYDHNKSSTYVANGTKVEFAKGMPFEVDGFVSSDQLIVAGGRGDQLKVVNVPFVELVSPDSLFEHFEDGLSGWVGFGPRSSGSTGAPSIVHSMISQGLLDSPMVGLSFAKNDAHVTFGGIAARFKYDDVTFFPLPTSGGLGWEVPVSGVRVGSQSVAEGRARGMLLSGFETINGPTDQVEAIADAVGAENYALPCAGPGPDVTLHLGTLAITLTKADYAVPIKDGICELVIQPSMLEDPLWFLGTPFLRRAYVVLDYGSSPNQARTGLAPLKSMD